MWDTQSWIPYKTHKDLKDKYEKILIQEEDLYRMYKFYKKEANKITTPKRFMRWILGLSFLNVIIGIGCLIIGLA